LDAREENEKAQKPLTSARIAGERGRGREEGEDGGKLSGKVEENIGCWLS